MNKRKTPSLLVNVDGRIYNLATSTVAEMEDLLKKKEKQIADYIQSSKRFPEDRREKMMQPFMNFLEDGKTTIENQIRITKNYEGFTNATI